MQVSGSLGDVMKESGRIAYSYAQNYLRALDPKNTFFSHVRKCVILSVCKFRE